MRHKAPPCPFPAVMVEWDDATSDEGGWRSHDTIAPVVAINYTVGLHLEAKSTATHVIIALTTTTGDETAIGDTITIPVPMVRKITRLYKRGRG